MTFSHPGPAPYQWFDRLASALNRRSVPRLALLFLVAVLARGRRTVTTRNRAVALRNQSRPCYTAAVAGKKVERTSAYLVQWVVEPLLVGTGWLMLALAYTPTRRPRSPISSLSHS